MSETKGKRYTFQEKLKYYQGVADGSIAPKAKSKFSAEEQINYAKGQAAARLECNAITAYNKATEDERQRYKAYRKDKNNQFKYVVLATGGIDGSVAEELCESPVESWPSGVKLVYKNRLKNMTPEDRKFCNERASQAASVLYSKRGDKK